MNRVARIDVGGLDKFERTPSGGLRVPGFLTRVGVLTYRTQDGRTVRELRPREEVFDAASLATLDDAPVTDLHPPSLVDPASWKQHAVGHVRAPRADGDKVAGDLLVLDAEAIRRIEAGERVEVSCGYTCELEMASGTYEGEPYDAIQRGIRYNHAGLGPRGWGRAGPEVALRLDAAHEVIAETRLDAAREKVMRKVKVDGIEFDAGSESHLQAIDKLLERKDGELAKLTAERDEAKGRAASLEQRADAAEKAAKETQAKLDKAISHDEVQKRVEARVALLDRARRVMGAEYDGKGKSDREVMADALGKAGGTVAEDASDDYVRGMFDAATMPPKESDGEGGEGGAPEPKEDRKDGGAPKVKTQPAPGPTGLEKVRADNAAWHAEAEKRFTLRKAG